MNLISKLGAAWCSGQKIKPNRTVIIPEPIIVTPMEQYFHVTSNNYDFLLTSPPNCTEIYSMHSDSPSNLLRKNAIHIFPQTVPHLTMMEKYRAHIKRIKQEYEKSYEKCKQPNEVFHMERRIKSEIWNRSKFIGRVSGKYKHFNLFKSINVLQAQKTLQQYQKNGVSVSFLGKNKIYPHGNVWLPTSDEYLKMFDQFLRNNRMENVNNILDLGCGSGVLSFILSKYYKSAHVYATDKNKAAINTTEINASSFGLTNIKCFQSDINKLNDFNFKLKQNKAPQHFQIIVANPPWIIAKKNQNQSELLDGVYDQKGKFLQSCFQIAKSHLKDQKSRFLLIYSDLSENLKLSTKSIQKLCKQHNFVIVSKLEVDYPKATQKQSPLAQYKMKSKIQLYELGRS